MSAGITQFTHHGIVFVPLGYTEPTGLQYNLVRFLPLAPSVHDSVVRDACSPRAWHCNMPRSLYLH